ncbi:3-hydroxyacid dehydrogenase/reductase [Cordyceps fumosorosea ARSEF 2679]|uniref:3-hydroxyacid dehydrogenase/reductase n=1 Tax=Cordyceps fumosorosea (strain ARSEF 2679) TaxID=1081104 RepID=A0A167SXH4_CORFA|nr:3-hydroxyacid dehydrogenase/reductase [Cordyceps fumosorosea ARSEF 2679]OAA60030.1 3-hydroxyacid dehydrogenase/reductase [Cordyceps fumosorosea ARSEF 2679]
MRVGFLGLGSMGTPMALNLAQHFPITVWNRTASKCDPFRSIPGAAVADSPAAVARQSDVVFAMLYDDSACRTILSDPALTAALRGKTLINTSSVSVACNQLLAAHLHPAGCRFLEMPVSGSRVPAEQGKLVGMLAGGSKEDAERLAPLLGRVTAAAVHCGEEVGAGLRMKFATNLFLITMTAGLAEAMHLARAQGLDVEAFARVLDAGPMASAYSRLKVAKMVAEDWAPQAAIADCYNVTELVQGAAAEAGAETPLMTVCNGLYREAVSRGFGGDDMIAIHKVMTPPERDGEDNNDKKN